MTIQHPLCWSVTYIEIIFPDHTFRVAVADSFVFPLELAHTKQHRENSVCFSTEQKKSDIIKYALLGIIPVKFKIFNHADHNQSHQRETTLCIEEHYSFIGFLHFHHCKAYYGITILTGLEYLSGEPSCRRIIL